MTMNVKNLTLCAAIALAASASGSVYAVGAAVVPGTQITQQFNLTANVNSTLQLTATDGSALSPNLPLDYDLGTKAFKPKIVMANLATNTNTNNIVASISGQPQVTNGSTTVPLKITMNGAELSSTVRVFPAADLFGSGGFSTPVTLIFSQKDTTPVSEAGVYTGSVQLMLQQQTPATAN